MTNYWVNLNERERWIVIGGSVCSIIYLLYLFVYSPFSSALNDKSKQLTEKKETLLWMQQVRQQPIGKNTAKSITGSKLLTLIATQLSTMPFQRFPHQIQQTSQGEIELTFDTVPYHPLLNWLWSLENSYIIVLKQVVMEQTSTPGMVKVVVVIAVKL